MSRERCIVDSTVLIRVILEKKFDLLEKLMDYEVYVPINVLEETLFKIIMLTLEAKTGTKKFYELKELFEKSKDIPDIIERIHLLNKIKSKFIVLDLNERIFDQSKKIIIEYRLLPNDALIAAAAKLYGIGKIATFDSDFRKVDFIEMIDLE